MCGARYSYMHTYIHIYSHIHLHNHTDIIFIVPLGLVRPKCRVELDESRFRRSAVHFVVVRACSGASRYTPVLIFEGLSGASRCGLEIPSFQSDRGMRLFSPRSRLPSIPTRVP